MTELHCPAVLLLAGPGCWAELATAAGAQRLLPPDRVRLAGVVVATGDEEAGRCAAAVAAALTVPVREGGGLAVAADDTARATALRDVADEHRGETVLLLVDQPVQDSVVPALAEGDGWRAEALRGTSVKGG